MNQGNKGLKNFGATCYLNSAIQCLIHLDILNPRNEEFKENIRKSKSKEYSLLKQWIQLYKEMWDDSNCDTINTIDFIRTFIRRCNEESIYFEVMNQNDVSEFLTGFINILHEEICRNVNITIRGEPENNMDRLQIKSINTWSDFFNKSYSLIIQQFYSQSINLTTCPECNYNTINLDPVMIINLEFDSTTESIYDCLNKYTEQFELDEENKWTCDKCKKQVQCQKKNKLWKLSPVVIFMIKQYVDNKTKIDKFIKYPKILNMENYCINYKNECMNYELQSMCIHIGGLGGGHYYAYCKNNADNLWHEYNDSHVKELKEEDVYNETPYCLFYQRV